MRFFFFGTLLDEEVLAFVVGRRVPETDKRPAILSGYRRVKAQGVTYPIVVPRAGAEVAGLLVSGLDEAEAKRLIAYEGANYELVTLPVQSSGRSREALVFVPVKTGGLVPLDEDWSYEDWQRLHRAGFVARLRRWKTADRAV
ncbi:MAG: gamma-glutamylcyclotransferase family protein [Reyranellaceae bacterium]